MNDTVKVDALVEKYVKLRDFKEEKEREMKANVALIKEKMDAIEGELMTFLNQTGQESANTKAGTFFKRTTTKCNVADWDVIFGFIQENDLYNFLNHAVKKEAVSEYIELNGVVPPGVNVVREVAISVNRPKSR